MRPWIWLSLLFLLPARPAAAYLLEYNDPLDFQWKLIQVGDLELAEVAADEFRGLLRCEGLDRVGIAHVTSGLASAHRRLADKQWAEAAADELPNFPQATQCRLMAVRSLIRSGNLSEAAARLREAKRLAIPSLAEDFELVEAVLDVAYDVGGLTDPALRSALDSWRPQPIREPIHFDPRAAVQPPPVRPFPRQAFAFLAAVDPVQASVHVAASPACRTPSPNVDVTLCQELVLGAIDLLSRRGRNADAARIALAVADPVTRRRLIKKVISEACTERDYVLARSLVEAWRLLPAEAGRQPPSPADGFPAFALSCTGTRAELELSIADADPRVFDHAELSRRGMPDLAAAALARIEPALSRIDKLEIMIEQRMLPPDYLARAIDFEESRLGALGPREVEWAATRLLRLWTKLGDHSRAWTLLERIAATPAQRAAKAAEIAEVLAEQGKEAEVIALVKRWSPYLPPPAQSDEKGGLPGFDRALYDLADYRNNHGEVGRIDDLIALAATPDTKSSLRLDAAWALAFSRRPSDARRLAALVPRTEGRAESLTNLEEDIATIERLMAKLPSR